MKRFHVHVAVADLRPAVDFYTTLFGAAPTVTKSDYAKWMLEDPRINFAISARGASPGVNHLGFQVETGEELDAMHDQLRAADHELVAQTATACCYAKADKYWVRDPAGVAWETFHSLESIPFFGEDGVPGTGPAACCEAAMPQAGTAGSCCTD